MFTVFKKRQFLHLCTNQLSAKPDEIRSIERNNQIDRYLATAYLTSAVITGSHFIVTAIVKAVYSKVVHGKFVWQLPLLQR